MHLFKLRLSTMITAVVALALLAVAIDWSTPTGVEAEAPNTPTWDSSNPVVSGDRTMTLNWNSASDATGYEYRYTNAALGFTQVNSDPENPIYACGDSCITSEWLTASTADDDTDKTIDPATTGDPTLTVGTTYWFQIRAVNTDDDPDSYSEPSEIRNALQRAAPAKLANVAAVAGNAKVTLSWDDPNDDTIVNYAYRQDAGGVFPDTWTTITEVTSSEGKTSYTVTDLTNGITYSFQVRATNNQGPQDKDLGFDTVSATPTGPPAAPGDLRAKPS